jgi:hypothetical protein
MLNTTNSTVADVQSTAGGGKVQREATTAAATAAATAPAATASATTSDEQWYNAGVQSSNAPTRANRWQRCRYSAEHTCWCREQQRWCVATSEETDGGSTNTNGWRSAGESYSYDV